MGTNTTQLQSNYVDIKILYVYSNAVMTAKLPPFVMMSSIHYSHCDLAMPVLYLLYVGIYSQNLVSAGRSF